MNIDGRHDRLTERHGSLTQCVELLTLDVRALTSKADALTGTVDVLVRVKEKTAAKVDPLVLIVTNRQQRLDQLGGA